MVKGKWKLKEYWDGKPMYEVAFWEDATEDYNEPLHYNSEHGDFRCSKGHIEDKWQYFRHDSREYLIETIMNLLENK